MSGNTSGARKTVTYPTSLLLKSHRLVPKASFLIAGESGFLGEAPITLKKKRLVQRTRKFFLFIVLCLGYRPGEVVSVRRRNSVTSSCHLICCPVASEYLSFPRHMPNLPPPWSSLRYSRGGGGIGQDLIVECAGCSAGGFAKWCVSTTTSAVTRLFRC